MVICFRDTIEKVLQKNNLSPSRVEFFKNDIDSQRLAAKKISERVRRVREEFERDRRKNLENDKSEEI